MADNFVAEIRMFAGNYAPRGWAFCNGDLMAISQNTALFSLLGTTYGGDGRSTFALPDLRGLAPLQAGQGPGLSNRVLGDRGGSASVTLTSAQMPAHSHVANSVNGGGDQSAPGGNVWAQAVSGRRAMPAYAATANAAMAAGALAGTGGSQPHDNMHPYLALNFIIALQGIFPPRPS